MWVARYTHVRYPSSTILHLLLVSTLYYWLSPRAVLLECLQGVGDAFVRIVREDGVSGLFRGATPTIVRAMALNMGMLASNDQAKESIEALGFAKGSPVPVLGGEAGPPFTSFLACMCRVVPLVRMFTCWRGVNLARLLCRARPLRSRHESADVPINTKPRLYGGLGWDMMSLSTC